MNPMLRQLHALILLTWAASPVAKAANAVLVGWNNLGMHCTDGFSTQLCQRAVRAG